ncbi:MAG TPA: helix-turn-helix domain-containing protein [Phycisphaerae bacterium]|nr:helix-turn-helix domain-containing protein [Phycisphaerae bacterium]
MDAAQHAALATSQRLAITADEVAELLGISRAHLWKLHSSGRLPRPIRLGRAVRWSVSEIQAWLAAGAPPRERWETVRSTSR